MRRLKQFLSESRTCDYAEIIFDADGDLTSLNNIQVRFYKQCTKSGSLKIRWQFHLLIMISVLSFLSERKFIIML